MCRHICGSLGADVHLLIWRGMHLHNSRVSIRPHALCGLAGHPDWRTFSHPRREPDLGGTRRFRSIRHHHAPKLVEGGRRSKTSGYMANIRFLRTFIAVSQHGSFAAAAESIGLTQSAVSQQMSALEGELRRSLFDRSGRIVMLNKTGRAILPKIEALVGQYESLRAGLAETNELSGSIAIGAVMSVMGALSIIVARLKSTYPRLEVRLSTGKSADLAVRIASGELDFAIAISGSNLQPKLTWRPLYSERMVILTHSNLSGPATPKIIQGQPFIRVDRATRTGVLVDKAVKKLRLNVTDLIEINSLDAIVELIRMRVGVAILPRLKYSSWETDASLRIIPLKNLGIERLIGTLENREGSHRKIREVIRECLLGDLNPTQ
jgi:DNA-binding transcriptional LysR family regulator